MNPELISLHVLRALALAQRKGTLVTLDALASELQIRRRDLRSAVTSLHRAGLVDALRMRVTLSGFALGHAFGRAPLRPVRRPVAANVVAA